jgi:exopolyphosphatase/guanosine-5'-triphosphate,3'-diphosphate pyrophosphatase
VADVDGADLAEVERLLRITRLGDRVDADGRLSDAGMERVHTVLEGYAARARELGAERVLATATSAVRDADNGSEFLAGVRRRHGFETRLLSGREEAELTYRGVTSRLAAQARGRSSATSAAARRSSCSAGPAGVLDDDQPRRRLRADVRALLRSDPPAAAELADLREAVAALLPAESHEAAPPAGRRRRHRDDARHDRPRPRPRDPRGDRRPRARGGHCRGAAWPSWPRFRSPSAARCAV